MFVEARIKIEFFVLFTVRETLSNTSIIHVDLNNKLKVCIFKISRLIFTLRRIFPRCVKKTPFTFATGIFRNKEDKMCLN